MSRPVALAIGALAVAVCAQEPQGPSPAEVRLIHAQFDPLRGEPAVPKELASADGGRLWIVQFAGLPTEQGRAAVRAAGGEIHSYLPDHAYVVRMNRQDAEVVRAFAAVRWVGRYHPAYRLEPALVAGLLAKALPTQRYNLVVADKRRDKPALGRQIAAIGGVVDDEHAGSILLSATLSPAQLLQVAALDEVLWIDRWTPTSVDVDNARIQGGANYIEAQGGYTGSGVNAHIYEGVEATHPDFTGGATNVNSGGEAQDHGHCTAGIVFGNGTSNPLVRGLAPDAGKFYTNYNTVMTSRWQVASNLVNIHGVSHTTASWGNDLTTAYTSISAEADDIIFDHDIPWTQSQSNAGNQMSRPQAWAKNIFSIGGVVHFNNSTPADDSWDAGGASTGPAADGRIKPDLCAYYDSVGTSDLTGTAGFSTGNWYPSFNGTSSATPIVAGHNVLAIQMFTDAVFGNTLRNPGGSRHSNRPHFTTLKALQIVSARQYPFTAVSIDNRRQHQGWGFPDLARMWNNRTRTFVVDETDVLTQGGASGWDVTVVAGEPELKICMVYADPQANPAAAKTRINDLSLHVVAPNGTRYWGNNGLSAGNYSVAGGVEDDTNTLECVFVQNPLPGVWKVHVRATVVAADSHVETPAVDADYGLVVSGGTGQAGAPPVFAEFANFGQGCLGSVSQPPICAQLNGNGGTLANLVRTNEYVSRVVSAGTLQVQSFSMFTRSNTGGTVIVGARLYANAGTLPALTPLATSTMSIGPTAGFYTATFAVPVNVTGNFFIGFDSTAQTTLLPQVTGGAGGLAYFRPTLGSGTWAQSGVLNAPGYRVTCTGGGAFLPPRLGNTGLPALGASYTLTLADAPAATLAIAVIGLSDQAFSGGPLPFALPGAPGCNLLVSTDSTNFYVSTAAGTASHLIFVPSTISLSGLPLFHQWLVLDNVNTLGATVSAGGRGTVGY